MNNFLEYSVSTICRFQKFSHPAFLESKASRKPAISTIPIAEREDAIRGRTCHSLIFIMFKSHFSSAALANKMQVLDEECIVKLSQNELKGKRDEGGGN